MLANARAGATWRTALNLQQPTAGLADALEALALIIRTAERQADRLTVDKVLVALQSPTLSGGPVIRLASAVLRPLLESHRPAEPRC